MNFTEETGIKIDTVDISTVIAPKKRGRPKKKATETAGSATEDASKLPSEKERLKQELLRLSDYHPEIVTKPVNDKLASLVEDMSIEELRERVRYGKRNQSSKMDNSVASQAIVMANQLTGRLLGCLEELNETSTKDKLLAECVKDYMCLNVLDYIPNELKIGGLYGSHVAQAYYTASAKVTPKVTEITEENKEELKKALSTPEMQQKMALLKSKMNGLGI
jgi:hypothetical protein